MINYGKRQFIRYVMMGLAFALVTFLLNACETKAYSYEKKEYVTYYDNANLNATNNTITNYKYLAMTPNINSIGGNGYRTTQVHFNEIDLSDYAGGYLEFSYDLYIPVVIKNETYNNTQGIVQQRYCSYWRTVETNEGSYSTCSTWNNLNSQETDYEITSTLITPDVYINAFMDNSESGSSFIQCTVSGSVATCPIPKNYKAKTFVFTSHVSFGSDIYQYNIVIGRMLNIYSADGKKISDAIQSQTEQQQSNHQQTMDTITDDSDQDVSSMSGATGWLPQGTIDGLINLPISLVQGITTGLQGNCTPLTLPLPFVNEDIQLPCIKTIFDQINGVSTLLNLICTPIMAIILYNYLKNLFQWMQSQIAMEGNSNWGGV